MKIIKIFLASSSELKKEREQFEIFINRKNKILVKDKVFLELIIWEDFIDSMSPTRLQSEYNKAIEKCNIFISLFFTKVGKYTKEEFETAFKDFQNKGSIKYLYTYFKETKNISVTKNNRKDLNSLWDFQEFLEELGHFQTNFETTEGLLKHFNEQLDKIDFSEFQEQNKSSSISFITENLEHELRQLKCNKNKFSKLEKDINFEQFENIDWEDLIEHIEYDNCVLFIGQGISIDDNGNSIHENFYKQLNSHRIKYNEKDYFFMPKTENYIKSKVINFYNNKFIDENQQAYSLLNKLTQLPFSLIVSICPDDTMHRIYEHYDKEHRFLFFNGKKQDLEEATINNPVLYNLLGNAGFNGKYIFTHKQFYDYMKVNQEVKLPMEIESKIQEAVHYIFLGVDFNKWYNRLLLFSLDLEIEKDSYAFNMQNIDNINKEFIEKQFNVSFIETNFPDFVDALLFKSQEAKLNQCLLDEFVEKSLKKLENISNLTNENALAEISTIKEKIKNIKKLYNNAVL